MGTNNQHDRPDDADGQGQSGYGSGRNLNDAAVRGDRQEEYWLDRDDRPHAEWGTPERIREAVCGALKANHELDESRIEVVVENGEVTLTGTVEDSRRKGIAEDVARRCPAVRAISNELTTGGNATTSTGGGMPDKPRA